MNTINKTALALFLAINCFSSTVTGFVNTVRFNATPKLRTATTHSMCKFNVSVTDINNIFERIANTTTNRRSMLGTATATAAVTGALLVSAKGVSAQDAQDDLERKKPSRDAWAFHKGAFNEEFLKDFTTTPSGLLYKDVEVGRGPVPNDGDAVTIDMVGYIFESGDKWTNTYKGIPAYQSTIRAGPRENQKFMKGLNEGVKDMKKGGKRILVIPAYLAYNYVVIYSQNDPSQTIIPGGAALVCYVEVLDFKKLS